MAACAPAATGTEAEAVRGQVMPRERDNHPWVAKARGAENTGSQASRRAAIEGRFRTAELRRKREQQRGNNR